MARASAALRLFVAGLAVCLASAPYLASFVNVGQLPNNDYYWIIGQITTPSGISGHPADWMFLKSNEHTVLLPAAIYVINIWVTGGDNRALSAVSLMMLTAVFITLYRLWFRSERWSVASGISSALALAVFIFAPATAHNFVMGFSGTIWFTANAFSMAAVAALVRRADGAPLWPVLAFGACAGLSYSTGALVWPALGAGAWLLRLRPRDYAMLAGTACAVLAFTLVSLEPVAGHPAPNTRDIGLLVSYVGGYVGMLSASPSTMAALLGWTGILASVLMARVALASAELRRLATPWIAIQVFVLTNALAAAVFRSGLPEGPGPSRYASLPALFWASFVAMAFLLIRHDSVFSKTRQTVRRTVLVVSVACLVVPMYIHGMQTLRFLLDRAKYDGVAAQALRLGLHDDDVLGRVTHYPEEVWGVNAFMRHSHHVPFQSTEETTAGEPVALAGSASTIEGHLDVLKRVGDRFVRADGWAHDSKGSPLEIVIVDRQGVVRAHATTGLPRPDVAEALGNRARNSGWSTYVQLAEVSEELRAYARSAGEGAAQPLIGVLRAGLNDQRQTVMSAAPSPGGGR